MREFWYGFFGSIAGVVTAVALLVIAAAFVFGSVLASTVQGGRVGEAVEADSGPVMLDLDLRGLALRPGPAADSDPMIDVMTALGMAGADPRIDGIFVSVGVTPQLPAQAEEIASALARLSASGRPVIAHVQDGERTGVQTYLAAAGADEIWAPPLSGLSAQPMTLDAGVAEPGRSALEAVAAYRRLERTAMEEIGQRGALTAQEARQAGFFDQIGQREEARAAALRAGALRAVSLSDYLRAAPPHGPGDQIALIDVTAGLHAIAPGAGSDRLMSGAQIAEAIHHAAADPEVRAIVVRLDVVGGDLGAADQVSTAIASARRSGVPVVTSVSVYATGAAYRIAAASDRIITPASATVGAFGTSAESLTALDGAGVGHLRLQQNRQAALITALAQARDLPEARIASLGLDQAWSGAEAVDLGLADSLGGLHDAVQLARDLAGLGPDEPASLVEYPDRGPNDENGLRRWVQTLAQ